jgi:glycosyltransferase involved in cell wall biosynthesis
MICSIILATRNHAPLLERTLKSIYQQKVPFDFEVVVTDDGSTDSTPLLLKDYPVRYYRLEKDGYGNPARALNNSMREARGDILIKQSDDVVHARPEIIKSLVKSLESDAINIAYVQEWDVEKGFVTDKEHVGPHNQRPLFFLGACWRADICKVGGYDDTTFADCRWYHDDWMSDCLTLGLGLRVNYVPLLGLHQYHPHLEHDFAKDKMVYFDLKKKGVYQSSTGPWPYQNGLSVNDLLQGKQ